MKPRFAQRLFAALTYAWLSCASLMPMPALASQASLVTPSSPLPMTGLASFLNAAFLSIGSCNSGNSAPTNGTGAAAFAGECWINTTSNPWVFSYTPDAVHWSEFGTLNTSTFVWTPYSNGVALTTGTSGATIPLNNGGFTQSGTANFTGPFQVGGNAMTFPGTASNMAYQVGSFVNGDCLKASGTAGGIADSGSAGCGVTSTPQYQIFTGVGGNSSVTLTNTPLPASAGLITVYFDGVAQARSNWSFNTGTDVLTIAIPYSTQTVEVDWFAPSASGINAAGATSGTPIVNGAANTMLVDSRSGGNDYVAAQAPTTFWDSFCGNTIGYIWVRMTGNWACNPAWAAPVTWWGAACNGSTNDTTAINTAIASGIKRLIVPGVCNVTTLNQLPTSLTIEGQNWLSSLIQTTSATGDVLKLSTGDEILNLGFTSTVTRTGGDFIHIGGGTSGTNVGNVELSHLYFANWYNAIEFNNAQLIRVTDILAQGQSWSHDCFLIDGASGSAEPYNTDIVVTNAVCTYGTNGVENEADGDVSFVRLQVFAASANGIILDPSGSAGSGNNIQWFNCSSCILDSNGSSGLLAYPTSGAGIYTIKLEDSWVATNGLWGVGLETDSGSGSAINETDLVNDLIANNAYYGVVLDDNSAVAGTNIASSAIAQNGIGHSGGGIYIGVGSNSFRINNNKIGASSEFTANNSSVNCSGSASPSEAIVTSNDMAGQSSSCGWTITVKQNNINF